MGTEVVQHVERVVLGIGSRDESRLVVEEDHINAISAAVLFEAWDLEVTLPVEAEGVAAVGNGANDERVRVVVVRVLLDELVDALDDRREVISLYECISNCISLMRSDMPENNSLHHGHRRHQAGQKSTTGSENKPQYSHQRRFWPPCRRQ